MLSGLRRLRVKPQSTERAGGVRGSRNNDTANTHDNSGGGRVSQARAERCRLLPTLPPSVFFFPARE